MKKFLFLFIAILCTNNKIIAQIYQNHFGAGNEIGVTATSSPNQNIDSISNTLNGTGYLIDRAGAYRLISQAGFGGSTKDVDTLVEMGVEQWINWQMNMPYVSFVDDHRVIFDSIALWTIELDPEINPNTYQRSELITYTFFEKMYRDKDKLRQKAAFALTQIFVINKRDGINGLGFGIADYYDIFYSGAFGNYRDMLEEVAYHPIMGKYLSHYKNEKAIVTTGTKPDENFAREIMQLFTIGLHELNNDGTLKLDSDGLPIPTYNIQDVEEMAKVFTGLSGGALAFYAPVPDGIPQFNMNEGHVDFTARMAMYADQHETNAKVIFDSTLVIPANQTGDKDIEDVLDYLFNHPNVGPFIALRLIQQLVKSSPSPQYINRIATIFNNNGNGIRGDMGAVFKAILMDQEARDCDFIDHRSGKLLQPIERLTQLMFALDMKTPSKKFWFDDRGYYFLPSVDQAFLSAPSVFNFFSPTYVHDACIKENNMYSPEFQILTNKTAISYINMLNGYVHGYLFKYSNHTRVDTTCGPVLPAGNVDDIPYFNFAPLVDIYTSNGIGALLEELNLILCRGQLSETTKNIIINTINEYQQTGNYDSLEMIKEAIFFIMLTPDYLILK